MRRADAVTLERALVEGRARLLWLFAGFERALGMGGLKLAYDPVINLPLWELGHIGWFEEQWIARNANRWHGAALDADAPASFPPSAFRDDADALYDSSKVAHASRWQLALPSPGDTCEYIARVRARTLELLHEASDQPDPDAALYFFRLALFHEDMHREAWLAVAQQVGIDLLQGAARVATRRSPQGGEWHVPARRHRLGDHAAGGFAFDNELGAHTVDVGAFTIDREPITWRRFLPFVDAGGYSNPALWSDAGAAWLQRVGKSGPDHVRRAGHGWEQRRFGTWQALVPDDFAVHLTAHEADAWCRWAGRRLPTEVEWEAAALLAAETGEPFVWGDVWEWTASPFAPFPGFIPHPYRDYSAPWFDGRPVLRGGSFATAPRMKHVRYRNFFPADRSDVFAGFRSCDALSRNAF